MIVLILGLVALILGVSWGSGMGFLKALLIAVVLGAILAFIPFGITVIEFPIGVAIGGLIGALKKK